MKRYAMSFTEHGLAGLREAPDGEWVRFSDVEMVEDCCTRRVAAEYELEARESYWRTLKAEVERLKKERDYWEDSQTECAAERDTPAADNARLRAALVVCRSAISGRHVADSHGPCNCSQCRAFDALSEALEAKP